MCILCIRTKELLKYIAILHYQETDNPMKLIMTPNNMIIPTPYDINNDICLNMEVKL